MELADVILGIKIKRTSDVLILSRSHYVDNILEKFDKDNSGITRTSVDVTLHFSKNKVESVFEVKHSRVIGNLMNLMSCTRLDITYVVKPEKNSNFLKKGKMVIPVKIWNFSRSRMMKRTSLLESSREI